MRRLIRQITLAAALLLTFTPSADAAGPLPTASIDEQGRAIAQQSAVIDVPAGSTVVVQKIVLQPGFSGLWPATVGDTVILTRRGTVATSPGCAGQELWEAGRVYLRRPGSGPADLLVKNDGTEAAELIVTFFNPPPGQTGAAAPAVEPSAAGCAPRNTYTATELSRVVNHAHDTLEMEAGTQLVVQQFFVEPGFNFFWHKHPGPSMALQKAGTITEYKGCDDTRLWQPGYGYIHTPGHHGHDQMTAKNEGRDTADLVVLWFNVPAWHPAPLVPRNVEPPPSGCPTASLV